MTTSYDIGREILSTTFKHEKNIDVLQKYIELKTDSEEDYIDLCYEVVAIQLLTKDVKKTLEYIWTEKYKWNHPVFDVYRLRREEYEEFLTHPLEVEEGVIECWKCQSHRTISYQRQIRSADEGTTIFAQCVQCGNKWSFN